MEGDRQKSEVENEVRGDRRGLEVKYPMREGFRLLRSFCHTLRGASLHLHAAGIIVFRVWLRRGGGKGVKSGRAGRPD